MLLIGVDAAIDELLDGDKALYLDVCGNTDIPTTYSRGTAAMFLPPPIIDASSPVLAAPPFSPPSCPLPSVVFGG